MDQAIDTAARVDTPVVVSLLMTCATTLDTVTTQVADDAERIDRIIAIRRAKAALAAAEALEMVAFAGSQERAQVAVAVPARWVGRGVPEQLALAGKCSPVTASRQLSFARALVYDLPATRASMAHGDVSEWAAMLVARESAYLGAADRRHLDADLASDLPRLSARGAGCAARRWAIAADPAGAVHRAARARADRHVSVRPAPDTMTILSALLPCEQGVAVYAALRRTALGAVAEGDERGLGQLMADTLVERATGQAAADAVGVEVELVMTPDALVGDDTVPARLGGYGPIPAHLARQLATAAPQGRRFLRRLLVDPIDGTVVGADRRRRRFDGSLARFLRLRDQVCRDPFCGAPVHDVDHIHAYAAGGPTTAENGQALCRRGNLVKQMPGWSTSGDAVLRVTVTPTGHRYESRPPPALGPGSVTPRPG